MSLDYVTIIQEKVNNVKSKKEKNTTKTIKKGRSEDPPSLLYYTS